MTNIFYFNWEVSLIEFLQSHMSNFMVSLASLISALGEELTMVLILGFFYWVYDKKTGVKIGINLMLGAVLNAEIKNLVLRSRPYMVHESINCLKPVDAEADIMNISAQGYSFPSGHSTNSAAIFSSIAFFVKNKLFVILAVILPLLTGISRFCLGVHYPTDVIAGLILGYAAVFIMPLIDKYVSNKRLAYIMLGILLFSGTLFCKSNDYYSSIGILTGLLIGSRFEDKYVKFEKPKKLIFALLRIAGGVVIFLGLNTLLKLPFSKELLESPTYVQFLIRFIRYALILFVETGIYPMLFKLERR